MSSPRSFDDRWSDFLEGELDQAELPALQAELEDPELLHKAADQFQIHRLLGVHGQTTPSETASFVESILRVLPQDSEAFVDSVVNEIDNAQPVERKNRAHLAAKWPIAGAVLLLIAACVWFWSKSAAVVEVTEVHGNIVLTGDYHTKALSVGERIPAGTLESLTADAWCTLRFEDNSTITVSGVSLLTFSVQEQKRLLLRRGSLSASVSPQPPECPMLVVTEAAELQVLGTQFNVEAEEERTRLAVNQGLVRLKRTVDGQEVDVPASHAITASVESDGALELSQREQAVTSWRADLQADLVTGKPVSNLQKLATELKQAVAAGKLQEDEALAKYKRAAAAAWEQQPNGVWAKPTKYGNLVVLTASRTDAPPTVIGEQARLRIQGKLLTKGPVMFGINVNSPGGGFAGKFYIEMDGETLLQDATNSFTLELNIQQFRCDAGEKLSPVGQELAQWWCFSHDSRSKIQISSVSLTN